jgi:alpha-N-arabinofuranosidase
VLRTEPVGPTHETARYGDVPVLDTVAVHEEEAGALTVFAVNRGEADLTLEVDLRGFPTLNSAGHVAICAGTDPEAVNTEADPDRVVPRDLARPDLDGGRCAVRLPGISWSALRFAATTVDSRA